MLCLRAKRIRVGAAPLGTAYAALEPWRIRCPPAKPGLFHSGRSMRHDPHASESGRLFWRVGRAGRRQWRPLCPPVGGAIEGCQSLASIPVTIGYPLALPDATPSSHPCTRLSSMGLGITGRSANAGSIPSAALAVTNANGTPRFASFRAAG
jgi:hypothetical protein